MSWRGECSIPSGETNFIGSTSSPAVFLQDATGSPDIAPSRNRVRSAPPVSTGVDQPVPSRHREHSWRGPLLRTGGAALALAGATAGLAATEPPSAPPSAVAYRDPCAKLPPLDETSHPSPQVLANALACLDLEEGRGKRSITVSYFPSSTASQRALLGSIVSEDLTSLGSLDPKIDVEGVSEQNLVTLRKSSSAAGATPVEQTPAYIESQQTSRDELVVTDISGNTKKLSGEAFPEYGIAEVITGFPQTDPLATIGWRNAHELGHLFGLGHAGKLIVNTNKPMSFSDLIMNATYQEYGIGDTQDFNNIMGAPTPLYGFTTNPVQRAELEKPAVLLHRAPPDAIKLDSKWLSINAKKASDGKFALAPLDYSFGKKGQDPARGNKEVFFNNFVFIPQTNTKGKISSVGVMGYDSIATHNTVSITTIPLSEDTTTIEWGDQIFQFKVDPDSNTMLLRTIRRDLLHGGLQAFLKKLDKQVLLQPNKPEVTYHKLATHR